MELKLVYRALRKVSDWTLSDYYSEVFVQGKENVPKDGPLIIASTHHNEIIDIAALAATIPYRRHLSFWAKSTMFANPVAGAVLSSTGAIPVRRNPNSNSTATSQSNPNGPSSSKLASSSPADESSSRAVLFRETSRALADEQVVGVFPEGTSYTRESIAQIMPGAAWAAVEYARYVSHDRVGKSTGTIGKGKGREVELGLHTGLKIVPVAIVYTDKARYQSRVSIKYGTPIALDQYTAELFDGNIDDTSKVVVKKIMGEVQAQLVESTINAPDWDTICAVSVARCILWEDENKVPLRDWVDVSQRLVSLLNLDSSEERQSVLPLKSTLVKYYALLQYAGIKHSVLLSILPLSASSAVLDVPPPSVPPTSTILLRPTISLIKGLPMALVRLALFVPPLLLHFPGYITGPLAAKAFAAPGEEEAAAQFKAIFGGVGIGSNVALALGVLWKQNKLGALTAIFGLEARSMMNRIAGLFASAYFGVWVLVKWHKLLVNANYRQLHRLLTYRKLFSAFALQGAQDSLTTAQAETYGYTKPRPPAINRFIKKRGSNGSSGSSPMSLSPSQSVDQIDSANPNPAPGNIQASKLMRPLLRARAQACAELSAYLKVTEPGTKLFAYLETKGAKLPTP